jgi:hypothetical protein
VLLARRYLSGDLFLTCVAMEKAPEIWEIWAIYPERN